MVRDIGRRARSPETKFPMCSRSEQSRHHHLRFGGGEGAHSTRLNAKPSKTIQREEGVDYG